MTQTALGRTLRLLAADGPDAYYRGPIGAAIAATVQRHGGVLTADDLAAHEPAWVDAMIGDFAGRQIAELPPPTQGVTALEMLRIADGFDVRSDNADRMHLLVEIVKLALADRDTYVADPIAMRIDPALLLSEQWIAERRAAVRLDRAAPLAARPTPNGDTAYLCCADADGLLVSLIQSNFTAIGSGLHVGEWGINLHNRGASFSLDAARANSLGPAKLPMHTLIPAMVLENGIPTHTFGTMGGHAQAQIHLQLLVRMLIDGVDPQAAIDAPRFEVNP